MHFCWGVEGFFWYNLWTSGAYRWCLRFTAIPTKPKGASSLQPNGFLWRCGVHMPMPKYRAVQASVQVHVRVHVILRHRYVRSVLSAPTSVFVGCMGFKFPLNIRTCTLNIRTCTRTCTCTEACTARYSGIGIWTPHLHKNPAKIHSVAGC